MSDFPFSTIGFDLDGTLVDTQGDLGVAVNHALSLIGRPAVSPETTRRLIGGGSRRMLQRALEETGGGLPDAEFDALYPELIAHYAANIAEHSRPYDGCLDALDALAGFGCALAVVTNKPEALSLKLLDELGMLARFACVIGGDTLPRAKPHRDTIDEAIARSDRGGRFAMVGDSSFDVLAAKAAGVPSVVLDFGYNDAPAHELGADAIISHYADLLGVLEKL
jgi:phosphoglycolate phosphatase